ncbi:MAG: hypothetical protein EZS28_045876 [Streblomastix strix]|uniref:Uncharacterized protein n=1 Tax=Streblomastix strix TaxID=222440 RepID=A0A5J4TK10_9EUKA|nr:MAG: hypothetical protein EZS28_045876 [Streblomastix strix]
MCDEDYSIINMNMNQETTQESDPLKLRQLNILGYTEPSILDIRYDALDAADDIFEARLRLESSITKKNNRSNFSS